MKKEALTSELIDFLVNEPACQQVIGSLNKKAEIAIQIAGSVELSVCSLEGKVMVAETKARAPDFIFSASPAAIEVLISKKGLSASQLGIKLLKQIVSRDIKISMPANVFQVTGKGYLNIAKVGGAEFLGELKRHNLASPSKILGALRKLRKG